MGNYSNYVSPGNGSNPSPENNPYSPLRPSSTLIQLRYGVVLRLDALRRSGTVVGALRVETVIPWCPYKLISAFRIEPDDRITAENEHTALKKAEAIARDLEKRWADADFQTQLVEAPAIDCGMAVDEAYINLNSVAL